MSYLSHDGLAYFKYKLANWVDANYLSKTSTGPLTVNGDVTFTQPIHGDIDGRAKKDWLGQQIDQTYVADIVAEDGALQLINGAGNVLKTVFDTTVTQKRSTANELYPLLLCYDASAEVDQLHKTVWFGSKVRSNPYYGYVALKGLYVQDSTNYNRRSGSPSTKKEWAIDFTDGVQGLGNPMAQVYEYVDTAANGGEHCIELRLYGNPNASPEIPAANDTTNTIHIGVGMTKGGAAPNGAPVKFGYCPSTPIYADNGTSFRTVGTDIITRDWLTLNGSITGLVHTTMDEVIDGNKTFRKTVVINSGDNSHPAGLQVQGDTNISGNGAIGQNFTVAGKTTTQTLEVKDDATVDGDLLVKGDETVNGNEHVKGNSTTDGNENVGGNINVEGTINKKFGNSTTEYVQYITNQPANRENIAANLIDGNKGLYLTSNGKIGVELQNNGGLKFDNNGGIYVDFSSATDDVKDAVLSSLGVQIPLTGSKTFYVNKGHSNATTTWRNSQGVIDKTVGTENKPFKTIQSAIDCATQGYSVGSHHINIVITKSSDAGYNESISLPQYQHTTGYIKLVSANTSSASNYAVITNKATTLDSKPARVVGGLVGVNGSGWYIENIKFDSQISDPDDGIAHFPSCVGAGTNASVAIRGCSFNFAYTGSAPNGSVYMRMISATSGGVVSFQLMESAQNTVSVTQGNANGLNVFFCERQGQINFNATNSGDANSSWHNIACSGSCSTFISLSIGSVFAVIGGATYLTGFTGNITGINCSVKQLSTLSCSSDLPSALTQGTKDSTSYVSSGIDVS